MSAEAESAIVRDGPLRGGNFLPRASERTAADRFESDLAGAHAARRDPDLRQRLARDRRRGGCTVLGQRPAAPRQQFSAGRHRKQRYRLHWRSAAVQHCRRCGRGVGANRKLRRRVRTSLGRRFQRGHQSPGTNTVHGTLFWRYQSQRFESVSNARQAERHAEVGVQPQRRRSSPLGGPIRKDKTFFFAAFQQDTQPLDRKLPAGGSHGGGCRPAALAVSLKPAA